MRRQELITFNLRIHRNRIFLSHFPPSLRVLCSTARPIFEWFLKIFFKSFKYYGYLPCITCIAGKDFLPFCGLLLYSIDLFLAAQKLLSFMKSHMLVIEQMESYSGSSFLHLYRVLLMLFFSSIITLVYNVSGFMFRSFIHVELVFIQDDRYRLNFILLYMVIQFSKLHCLRCSFFTSLYFYHLCQMINGWSYICLCLSLWFYSTGLLCLLLY